MITRRNLLMGAFIAPVLCILPKTPYPTKIEKISIRQEEFVDLYISPEDAEVIKRWSVYQIDSQTRRELYYKEIIR
jgi:hypothetical protein